MGFIIIGICGFVLGIIAVILLAVVGYFAEKKNVSNEMKLNTQNSNVVKNTVQIDNAINDVPIDSGIVTFDELPNVNKKINDIVSDLSDENIKKEHEEVKDESINSSNKVEVSSSNINNGEVVETNMNNDNISSDVSEFSVTPSTPVVDNSEISTNSDNQINTENNVEDKKDNQGFSLNNFENVEMSLDDLEKKNYDEIANEKNSTDDENYYYSNLEENSIDTPIDEFADNSVQNDLSQASEDIQEPTNEEPNDTGLESNSSFDDVQSTNDAVSASDFFNSESTVNSVDSPVELNNEIPTEVADIPAELNNEVPTETIETPIEEVSNDVNAVHSEPYSESAVDDSTEVPEVFDGEVASTDDEGNSLDEIPTETYSNDVEVPEMSEGGFSISDDSTDDDIWKF